MITISSSAMLIMDIAVIVLYVWFLISGYKKGLILQIFTLLDTVLSLFLAWRYCDIVAKRFVLWPRNWTPFQDTLFKDAAYAFCNQIICFLVIFLILKLVFLLLEHMIEGIHDVPVLKQIGGIFGSLLGIIGATIWAMVICVILNLPLFTNGAEAVDATLLGKINTCVLDVSSRYGGPVDSSDIFNKIYTSTKDLNEKDRQQVQKWLDDNGFKELESFDDKESE